VLVLRPVASLFSSTTHATERKRVNVNSIEAPVLYYAIHCIRLYVISLYATGIGDRKAVRPSVCPHDKRVNCDRMNETSTKFLNQVKDQCIYFL